VIVVYARDASIQCRSLAVRLVAGTQHRDRNWISVVLFRLVLHDATESSTAEC